ncbi:MAG: hypothetical protein RID07_01250 [Lacipirellulaceae bacterium]
MEYPFRFSLAFCALTSCLLLLATENAQAVEYARNADELRVPAKHYYPPDQSTAPDGGELLECEGCDAFGEPVYDDELYMQYDAALWRPFDLLRDFGFRHSATHGRHVGRGVPLERTSWLNRPYHVDWFLGPLLSDDLVTGSVGQSNDLFGGFRIGWDFDYYWGIQGRLGWSNPDIQTAATAGNPPSGNYFVGDIDILYYPWGDTKVRPYMLLGVGLAEVGSVNPDGSGKEITLLGMPFGGGVEFPQTPWLVWRLEVLDNLAFGADGVSTMHNISLTAGMELRLGARPRSYWPWRSSRNVW